MKHKYIVMAHQGEECIFVFPRNVSHDYMFEACERIRFDSPGFHGNWKRKYKQGEIVSAGFITAGKCHGESETLGLKSRPVEDTALLNGDSPTAPL